jgi:hypothetical protein
LDNFLPQMGIPGRDDLEIWQPSFPPPDTRGDPLILDELSPTRKLCQRIALPQLCGRCCKPWYWFHAGVSKSRKNLIWSSTFFASAPLCRSLVSLPTSVFNCFLFQLCNRFNVLLRRISGGFIRRRFIHARNSRLPIDPGRNVFGCRHSN